MNNLISKERYNEIKAILASSQSENCFSCKVGDFSPKILINARAPIININLPVTDIIISRSIGKIMSTDEWSSYIDFESNMENLRKGHLGLFFGMHLWGDVYLPITEQFMEHGEILLLSEEFEIFSSLIINF